MAVASAADAASAAAGAADAAGDAAAESTVASFSDIVVTAQKRETKLQETPLSITALSASSLGNSSVFDVNDVARATPGLVVTDMGPGARRLSLRGIRTNGEPQVALYYDEAPLAGSPGASSDAGRSVGNLQLFDVERLEVLRGPQGTLYGASSMGGALRVIYNKPVDRFEAGADLVGSTTRHAGENYQLNGMVNVPLAGDALSVRAVAFRHQSAGWINIPAIDQFKVNKNTEDGGHVLVHAQPVDAVGIDLGVYYSNERGQNPSWAPSYGRYVSPNRIATPTTDKSWLYNATVNADLGFSTLVVTGTFQDRNSLFLFDNNFLMDLARQTPAFCLRHLDAASCATPEGQEEFGDYLNSLTPMAYIYTSKMKNYAGEARLQSNGDSILSWTVGGYWSYRKSWLWSDGRHVDSHGELEADLPTVYSRRVLDKLRQLAGFGELSLKPVSGLTITGGIRYYHYTRIVAGDTQKGFDLINFAVQPWTVRETEENGALYKANISYQATPDILFYAQAASGFRPGGANQVLGLPSAFTPYRSDSLWTYEAGAKSTLMNGQLLFNLTGYWTNWKDLQVQGTSGTYSFLTNAGNARVKGIEAEAVAAPTDGLEFTGSLTLLSAQLTTDQVNNLVEAEGRKGDRIPQVANVTLALSGQYSWDIGHGLQALLRADYSYTGRSYSQFRPTSALNQPMGDYSLVGLRAGIGNDRLGAYLFVTNLFDVDAVTTAGTALYLPVGLVTTAPPRTIGLNLKFGL